MKIHLSGIAGTAMASLAGLLRERGHEVTGSDQDVYPPMSTQLEALGIPVRSPYAEGNVPADADAGRDRQRALPRQPRGGGRPRPQAADEQHAGAARRGVPPRPQSLVVAGTHGKTTTTSLLAFILHQRRARTRRS